MQDETPDPQSPPVATEWRSPRSAWQLFRDTSRLYGSYPRLFLILATVIVVPIEVATLATVGWDTGIHATDSVWGWVLLLLNLVLVLPLISALHVHAAADAREGREPRIADVSRRGLLTLPLVAAAAIASALLVAGGLILLVVPGIVLFLRWVVVAQAAAIERLDWRLALSRSRHLSRGNYRHIVAFLLLLFLFNLAWTFALRINAADAGSVYDVLSAVAVRVITLSFDALGIAVLYFDLVVRDSPAVGPIAPSAPIPRRIETAPVDATATAGMHPQDPRRYRDDERPPGWYFDPASPDRMQFWMSLGKPPRWGEARPASKRERREWHDLNAD